MIGVKEASEPVALAPLAVILKVPLIVQSPSTNINIPLHLLVGLTIKLSDIKRLLKFLIIGSPGGSTIITTVFQVIMNVIDHGMDIQTAVDAYRFHNQLFPDRINYEKFGFSEDVIKKLKDMGYTLFEQIHAPNEAMGIYIDPKTGYYYGGADTRGYGAAVGY